MAEQNSGGQADQESKKAKDTAGEVAKGASKAGKAAAGALKGFAQGGVAGAAVNVIKSGGGKYCIIGGCVGCMLPIILFVCLISFIGSLITGWFFGTVSSKTPDEDPGTVYSAYAAKIGDILSEMYAENIYDINDYVKSFPSTETKEERRDGINYVYTTNNVVGEVTINDDNIIEGSEEETGNGVRYDVDFSEEISLIIAAYSITQPYNATTTRDAEDIAGKIGGKLRDVQVFPMDDPTETMGIEEQTGREVRYKQATDEYGYPEYHDNGTPVYEHDSDGNKIIDEIVETKQVPWNLEFTIEDFDKDEVYELFDIDPDARYVDLIEETNGDDTAGGTIVYTFDNFLKLSDNATLEGTWAPIDKDEDSDKEEDPDKVEERRQKWLNSIIGPFMYVDEHNKNNTFKSDGGVTYPDDEDRNIMDYDIVVYNNSSEYAIAVVEMDLDNNSLNYQGNTGTSSTLGVEDPGSQPNYDEDTGLVTWEFSLASHRSKYVGVRCTSNESAYKKAMIEEQAEVTLYEAVCDENGKPEKDEDGNYILGDMIYHQTTNKTRVSTPITNQTDKKDDEIISNRDYIDMQHDSIISELWNVDDPTENMEDQIYTIVINGASDVYVGEFGSGAFSSISGYVWPLEDYGMDCVSSTFGWRTRSDGTREYHPGLDIGKGVPEGAKIVCVKDGTVERVGYTNARGNYVVINHGGGIYTMYQHMRDPSGLVEGADVKQNETVGFVGNTGDSEGNHLHFELIDSSRGSSYYASGTGEASRPLCVDPMILYTSSSAEDGAVSLGSNYQTILNMLLSTASSFVDESPYVKAGHGNTIGEADPATSKSHLIDYFEEHSNLFTERDKEGFENIVNQSTDITTLWDVLNSSLKNKGYSLGTHTNTNMPYVFDCSGLTGYIYSTVNIDITLYIGNSHDGQLSRGEYVRDGTGAQISNNTMSSKDYSWSSISGYVKPGDLIYTRSGKSGEATHVIFYLGDGKYVSAPSSGQLVKEGNVESDYWNQGRVVGIKRFIKE